MKVTLDVMISEISYLPGAFSASVSTAPIEPPCTQSPELFFAEQMPQLRAAQQVCEQCPLRALCLSEALERGEPWGVWGGKILVDGVIVEHKRGRGRPRKDERASA